MSELQKGSSADNADCPSSSVRDGNSVREQRVANIKELILELQKKLNGSITKGKQQQEQLNAKINQSDVARETINHTYSRTQLNRLQPSFNDFEEDYSKYFKNSHIPESDKYRAGSFLEVFCVLFWDLLKAYDEVSFQRLTSLMAMADFTKYPQTSEYISRHGTTPKKLEKSSLKYLKDMKAGKTLKLAHENEFFQEYIRYMMKYIILEKGRVQTISDLRRMRIESDESWASVQEPLERILTEDVADMELKKTENDQYCFLLNHGKLVIVRQGEEFVGHVEAL